MLECESSFNFFEKQFHAEISKYLLQQERLLLLTTACNKLLWPLKEERKNSLLCGQKGHVCFCLILLKIEIVRENTVLRE
jgi:hypothetical protein